MKENLQNLHLYLLQTGPLCGKLKRSRPSCGFQSVTSLSHEALAKMPLCEKHTDVTSALHEQLQSKM